MMRNEQRRTPMRSRTKAFLVALSIAQAITLHAQERSIILGRPTDHSITANILFAADREFYIEYGTTTGAYANMSATVIATSGEPHELDLAGLLPDTRYYYRMQHRAVGVGAFTPTPEYAFHTQRAPGSTFTFTVEADEHLYDKKGVANLYSTCLGNQAADQPDFMLSLGDIFGDDHEPDSITSGEMDTLHLNYRPFLGSLCHSVPFYVCLGNHEGENDYYLAQDPPNNIAAWGTQARKRYYPNPFPNAFYSGNMDEEPWGIGQPENYYAWTWGDALFVVLDVYRDQCDTSASPGGWNWSLGWPQYSWLKTTLENSTAPNKFVFAHHVRGWGRGGAAIAPFFEWGGYANDGTTYQFDNKRPGWGSPIHQLFIDNGVDIFFQGHDHLFAHEVLDGVTYQEVPMPSDSTYEIGMLANADAYTADTIGGSGHLRVTVEPSCVTVEFVRAWLPADTMSGEHANGEVAFSYTIGTCANGVSGTSDHAGSPVLWPNPASAAASISMPWGLPLERLDVFNALGERVIAQRTASFSVLDWPAGLYMVRVWADGDHRDLKLLVDH